MIALFFALSWLAGFLVLGRLPSRSKPADNPRQLAARTSVIIPARNEQDNLPTLLRSLKAQEIQPREIIVVDDDSTDGTAKLARQHEATVVASRPLPDGWRGKTWACHQGAQAASGDLLLFLDADTWFGPGGFVCALSEFPPDNRGALSLAPFHCVRNFHEQFSLFFNLVMLAGTGAFTLLGGLYPGQKLLGQFLLVDRETYAQAGGHEAVKSRVLENFWLANLLHRTGVPVKCCSGKNAFSFRMYPDGWRQLVGGWIKSFASGASRTPIPILTLIVIWLGGLILAPFGLCTQASSCLWLACYSLGAAQVAWFMRGAGTFHWLCAVFYPLFVLFFFAVFTQSVFRSGKTVNWKGRQIRAH